MPKTRRVLSLVLLISLGLSACNHESGGDFVHRHQGRSYRLHVPSAVEQAPLVVVMHGYGGDGEWMKTHLGWVELAEEQGFAVCFPDGTLDESGRRFWNVGYAMHDQSTVDDTAYLVDLVEVLRARHGLHPEWAYATGFSNGADMSYLLACKAAGTFQAIGPVAGTMMDSLYFQSRPDRPCSVIAFNGIDDEITRFDGDPDDRDGWGPYRSVPEVTDFWVQANHLTEFEGIRVLDPPGSRDSGFELDRHWRADSPVEVRSYRILGGGHEWPTSSDGHSLDATRIIWEFFASGRSN